MTQLDRRELLALGCAMLFAKAGSAQERRPSKLTPPPTPKVVPKAWLEAPSMPIWPGEPPGSGFAPQTLPADWPPVFVRNVARPKLHVFRPSRPNGDALLVVPGGAYQFVSISNEGVEIGARMTALGITVFVLTYRLPGEGWAHRADVPLQDAQRAMRVIRSRAARFGVDERKVGVLGFSAGGHLAAARRADLRGRGLGRRAQRAALRRRARLSGRHDAKALDSRAVPRSAARQGAHGGRRRAPIGGAARRCGDTAGVHRPRDGRPGRAGREQPAHDECDARGASSRRGALSAGGRACVRRRLPRHAVGALDRAVLGLARSIELAVDLARTRFREI